MAVEDFCAAMVNVSALLTSVMGLKSVQMAVMKPVSCKPSLHRQSVVHFQHISVFCAFTYRMKIHVIDSPPNFYELELALSTHQCKHTNTLYMKVELC